MMEILDWLENQRSAECKIAADEIKLLRQQLAEQPIQDKRDAARWHELIGRVGATAKGFYIANWPDLPDNWMRGSISQHFTKAIDKAMSKDTPHI